MEISVSLLILYLFLNILLVKSDNSLLKLFEVGNVMEALENIILELLFKLLLLIQLVSKVLNFIGKTFLSHSEIIDDQSKILIDSVEMLEFLSHLISLLIKFLDFKFSGSNISLKLLNLVIKHELKLFKFLYLLFQIVNSLVLILNGSFSLLKFSFLRLDLLSQ